VVSWGIESCDVGVLVVLLICVISLFAFLLLCCMLCSYLFSRFTVLFSELIL
jgi:hypothetical protein